MSDADSARYPSNIYEFAYAVLKMLGRAGPIVVAFGAIIGAGWYVQTQLQTTYDSQIASVAKLADVMNKQIKNFDDLRNQENSITAQLDDKKIQISEITQKFFDAQKKHEEYLERGRKTDLENQQLEAEKIRLEAMIKEKNNALNKLRNEKSETFEEAQRTSSQAISSFDEIEKQYLSSFNKIEQIISSNNNTETKIQNIKKEIEENIYGIRSKTLSESLQNYRYNPNSKTAENLKKAIGISESDLKTVLESEFGFLFVKSFSAPWLRLNVYYGALKSDETSYYNTFSFSVLYPTEEDAEQQINGRVSKINTQKMIRGFIAPHASNVFHSRWIVKANSFDKKVTTWVKESLPGLDYQWTWTEMLEQFLPPPPGRFARKSTITKNGSEPSIRNLGADRLSEALDNDKREDLEPDVNIQTLRHTVQLHERIETLDADRIPGMRRLENLPGGLQSRFYEDISSARSIYNDIYGDDPTPKRKSSPTENETLGAMLADLFSPDSKVIGTPLKYNPPAFTDVGVPSVQRAQYRLATIKLERPEISGTGVKIISDYVYRYDVDVRAWKIDAPNRTREN